MRTTIDLADDVASAVKRLRSEQSMGLSEAVNVLARRGLAVSDADRQPFRQTTRRVGLKVDVTDVAEAIEELEGADWR